MTIDEAIEQLQKELASWGQLQEPKAVKGLKLGIEALMRIKEQRDYRFSHMSRLLPGETEG